MQASETRAARHRDTHRCCPLRRRHKRPSRVRDMSAIDGVSDTFDPEAWDDVPGFDDLVDLTYHRAKAHGTVRIAFDRPDVLNAFRPGTVDELLRVLEHARTSSDVGCVLLTGNGPSAKSGKWAFCSGGDQRIRGRTGYQYAEGETAATVDKARLGRLHILECQRLIRFMPKVVVCVVPGWTAGGGHSLHSVCDLTLASREEARFKQTDADVGSFDGGYGSAYLARQVGQKYAREIFFLGQEYSAEDGMRMGTVNRAVPHAEARGHRPGVGPADQRQVPHRRPDAQVLLQRHRRRPGRPAALRRRDHPPRLHDRRGPGGPRPVSREAGAGLEPVPLVLLSRTLLEGLRRRPRGAVTIQAPDPRSTPSSPACAAITSRRFASACRLPTSSSLSKSHFICPT